MIEKIKNFLKDEEGASMVEYGLLVALIAIVCIGALTLLGGSLSTKFGEAQTAVAGAGGGGAGN